ncbi:hypothetical protein [Streptomyces showdoensis]|uniref:hypothetical protein n=1 Tax=Streptomyces showdoensis TaxID=68268 RepID=UPI0013F4F80F|nr:hypothetical protein [Streptomyces showdoensis]
MGKKDTIRAAKNYTARDTRDHPHPPATQSSLGDRHARTHTPESLYPGPDTEDSTTE